MSNVGGQHAAGPTHKAGVVVDPAEESTGSATRSQRGSYLRRGVRKPTPDGTVLRASEVADTDVKTLAHAGTKASTSSSDKDWTKVDSERDGLESGGAAGQKAHAKPTNAAISVTWESPAPSTGNLQSDAKTPLIIRPNGASQDEIELPKVTPHPLAAKPQEQPKEEEEDFGHVFDRLDVGDMPVGSSDMTLERKYNRGSDEDSSEDDTGTDDEFTAEGVASMQVPQGRNFQLRQGRNPDGTVGAPFTVPERYLPVGMDDESDDVENQTQSSLRSRHKKKHDRHKKKKKEPVECKPLFKDSTILAFGGFVLGLLSIIQVSVLFVMYVSAPIPPKLLFDPSKLHEAAELKERTEEMEDDMRHQHEENEQYKIAIAHVVQSFANQGKYVAILKAPAEGTRSLGHYFMASGMWGMKLVLRRQSGETQVVLKAESSKKWVLSVRFQVNDWTSNPALNRQIGANMEIAATLEKNIKPNTDVRVEVTFLSFAPPRQEPKGKSIIASDFASRSVSKAAIAKEETYAFRALLRVQSVDKHLLARAMKLPSRMSHFNEQDLKTNLDIIGPELIKDQNKVGDWFESRLAQFVGMAPLKNQLRNMRDRLKFYEEKAQMGMKLGQDNAMHMIFKGNPGCGKTVMANFIKDLLLHLNIITKNKIVTVQRGDLVAQAVGQTIPKTRKAIDTAKGGIFFVDEAYRLNPPGESKVDFGKEAMDEIMQDLTSGDPLVILAGYTDPMDSLLKSNPGNARRFPWVFDFPDYSPTEIAEIFILKADKRNFILAPDLTKLSIANLLEETTTETYRKERNGGLAQTLIDEAEVALAQRLPKNFDRVKARTLEFVDVQVAAHRLSKGTGN